MARTQKNFSVLGDSISTFQGYSPWGAAHYSPDLGAATGVHTVEDTWWMQVIRALQGRLLSNLSISGNTISTAGTMGGFPASNCTAYRRWRHARPHPSLCRAQRRQFLCAARRVPPGIPAAALPSSANLSPRTDQLRHIDFGCRSRDSGLPLLSCAAFGPLQPGHPLCRGAGRLSAGGLGRYAFPLRCPGRIPSQWNWHGTAGQALAPRNGSFLIGQKLFLILYSFFHFSLR